MMKINCQGVSKDMLTLRSSLSPHEFVTALVAMKKRWRKHAGGNPSRIVHALSRRRTQWYKRVTGVSELPKATNTQDEGALWVTPNLEQLKVVVAPRPESEADFRRSIGSVRKRLRRSFHRALDDAGRGFSLVSSKRSSPSGSNGLPSVATSSFDGRPNTRAVYLEELGAAIVPFLSDPEIKALEAEGATILDNDLVILVDDFAQASVATTANVSKSRHLEFIQIQAAKDKGLSGSGVSIGILDSGIDAAHPEFKSKSITFQAFKGDGTKRALKKTKDFGDHGTHVAALCAGKTVGVAPEARLVVAAVLTERDEKGRLCGYRAQILAGLNWLARGDGGLTTGVDVVNASIGGSDVHQTYYDTFAGHRGRGILTIAAIGNNGYKGAGYHTTPGKFDCVVGVGAIGFDDRVAAFSDWGPTHGNVAQYKPDLVAPGVEIVSAAPNGRYVSKNGTSMASPIVAGAAALLIEADGSLRHNPQALAVRLTALTRPLPILDHSHNPDRCGHGCLDLTGI